MCHTHVHASRLVNASVDRARAGGSRFLQVDPVEGGSANDYDYAMADPVNNLDLDGRRCIFGTHGGKKGRCRGKSIVRAPTNVAGRVWSFHAEAAGGKGRNCGRTTRCVDNSHLLVPWARAGTLGNTIVCRRECDADTIAHEKVHVRQFQQGGVGFVGAYAWESMFGGWQCGNKYERPGYAAEGGC